MASIIHKIEETLHMGGDKNKEGQQHKLKQGEQHKFKEGEQHKHQEGGGIVGKIKGTLQPGGAAVVGKDKKKKKDKKKHQDGHDHGHSSSSDSD